MATKGAQAAEDSTDSDDSMGGRRPDLSAEERSLPDDLLKNSNAFIRLYEEHQPGLQKIISDLEGSSERFLDRYEKATKLSIGGGAAAGAGLGAAVLLAPFTFGVSLVPGLVVAAAGTTVGVVGNLNKGQEGSKALEDVKKALEIFNTRAETVTRYLNNVCDQVGRILQCKNDKQSLLMKSQVEKIRRHKDELPELANQFTAEDLRRLLNQGTRALHWTRDLHSTITALLVIFGFLNVFEDNRTLRDVEKLRENRFGVQERELQSKAGRFIWKMRETINHLQNTLNEISTSKTQVEEVIVPKLKEYLRE